jgi:hypothetical protein
VITRRGDTLFVLSKAIIRSPAEGDKSRGGDTNSLGFVEVHTRQLDLGEAQASTFPDSSSIAALRDGGAGLIMCERETGGVALATRWNYS